ncbi:MAG: hypothetical protein C0432_04120 [Candidatus Puniceispirillum sp.]|nr:hypothetical protein [Candidatus Pelagibacter sp.]MBA4283461.1 hypothetical protein [Candidatus Puniceispirillum sp.]
MFIYKIENILKITRSIAFIFLFSNPVLCNRIFSMESLKNEDQCKTTSQYYRKVLQEAETEFDNAKSTSEKYSIVSTPVAEMNGEINIYFDFPIIRTITLAVCMGDVSKVEKFLSAIDDVNSEALDTWGYRQRYTLAHTALHPNYWVSANIDENDRLNIIHLLGRKNADFNLIRNIKTADYQFHPLYCGKHSGNYLGYDWVKKCAPIAVIYGADPSLARLNPLEASFESERYNEYYSWLFKSVLTTLSTLEDKSHVRLANNVKERLQCERDRINNATKDLF